MLKCSGGYYGVLRQLLECSRWLLKCSKRLLGSCLIGYKGVAR